MSNNDRTPKKPTTSHRDDSRKSSRQDSFSSSSSKKDEKSTSESAKHPSVVSLAHIDRQQPTSNPLLGRLQSLRKEHRSTESKQAHVAPLAHVDRQKTSGRKEGSTSSRPLQVASLVHLDRKNPTPSSSKPAPPSGNPFGAKIAHLDRNDKQTASSSSNKPKLVKLEENSLDASLAKPKNLNKNHASLPKPKKTDPSPSSIQVDKRSSPPSSLLKSIPPSSTKLPSSMGLHSKSHYTTEHDLKMAHQQTQYATLPPEKRTKQEDWAQSKMAEIALCPGGWGWKRIEGGYHCSAEMHYIPDWLLAEGRGGLMMIHVEKNRLEGPFYGRDGIDSEEGQYWVQLEELRRHYMPRWEQEALEVRRAAHERKWKREKERKN